MAIYIKPSWRKYIPHLEIYINVPLIRVQTMVFQESLDLLGITYLGLAWRIWKWEGNIRLFEANNRFNAMLVKEDDVKRDKCGCWYSGKYSLQFYCKKHKLTPVTRK